MGSSLRFFGIVTASVSHELNNVNSTIEQIAGLLDDHLALVARGGEFDAQRMQDVHARIVRQTRRSADVIARLNRFAHTADDPRIRFELNGLLDDIVGVCERLAQGRRIGLVRAPATDEIWLTGDPFLLSQAVFAHLRAFWESAPVGAEIAVSAAVEGDDRLVRISGPASLQPEESADPPGEPARLACRLAADIDDRVADDRRTITIALPAERRRQGDAPPRG
ncbi:hypothetical protein KJ554_06175 [bacterium]|nr:hypothetical protein [bacterium]